MRDQLIVHIPLQSDQVTALRGVIKYGFIRASLYISTFGDYYQTVKHEC